MSDQGFPGQGQQQGGWGGPPPQQPPTPPPSWGAPPGAAPQPGYPPADGGHPPQAGGYPQPGGYPPPGGGYPQPGGGYPPPGGFPPPGSAGSGGGNRKGLIVVAVVAVVAIIGIAFVLTRGDDDGSSAAVPDGLLYLDVRGPTSEVEEQWKEAVDCQGVETYEDDEETEGDATTGCELGADDEHVYVWTYDGEQAKVLALDGGSGEEAWSADVDGDAADLLVTEEAVLVTVSDENGDDTIVALDPGTGEERWDAKATPSAYGRDGVLLAYSYDYSDGETSETMLALDLEDGSEVWSLEDSGYPNLCGDLVLSTSEAKLLGFDFASGEKRFEVDLPSNDEEEERGNAACTNGVLVAQDEDDVRRLSPDDGEEQWKVEVPGLDSLNVVDGMVLAVTDDEVVALDGSDGEERWKTDLDEYDDRLYGYISFESGRALASTDGDSVLIDLSDGSEINSYDGSGAEAGSLAQGLTYLVDGDKVTAYGLSDVEERWESEVAEGGAKLEAGGGRLYLLTADTVLAYG